MKRDKKPTQKKLEGKNEKTETSALFCHLHHFVKALPVKAYFQYFMIQKDSVKVILARCKKRATIFMLKYVNVNYLKLSYVNCVCS